MKVIVPLSGAAFDALRQAIDFKVNELRAFAQLKDQQTSAVADELEKAHTNIAVHGIPYDADILITVHREG